MSEDAPIRVGVSACLLGQEVRYDGRHKREPWVAERLARLVELVPVCPEVEVGMGVPREPVRLVQRGGEVRMVGVTSGTDHTDAMRRYAERRVEELAALRLCGYVLKARSPSCGLERVELVDASGAATEAGRGLFAAALRARFPRLPIEEEAALREPAAQERFVEQVRAYAAAVGVRDPNGGRSGSS